MPSDQDLSYLDLLAVRALLLWPLLAWALLFYFLGWMTCTLRCGTVALTGTSERDPKTVEVWF